MIRKFIFLSSILFLFGCGTISALNPFDGEKKQERLEGERISVLELQKALEPDDVILETLGFVPPNAWQNQYWPQTGGYPNHAMQNLELSSGELEKMWSIDIGAGEKDNLPLTAQPIVFDGHIFVMDAESRVTSVNIQTGKRAWQYNLKPKEEDEYVISGGLAYSAGTLYATSGFNELFALNPSDGKIKWKKALTSPSRAAPTVIDNRIFVVTIDNRIYAFSAEDGSRLWSYQGLSSEAGLVGMAAPAANRDIVVPAFSSGEIYALRVENGSVAWVENLASTRHGSGLSSISDIRALPVMDKGAIIAMSYGGKIVALDERTGNRIWQREIGGSQTPWVAGNHLFMLTSNNELAALGRDQGKVIWVTQLPKHKKPKSREGAIALKGPILAGGRLIVAGSNGMIYEIDPTNGKMLRDWSLRREIVVSPIVAGGVMYILTANGMLHAYR
ncbi:MAG: PQQ-binding-like beta-propeller repeat protein [Alphaproteobacteria bacterium]|nr:PQQ-binding-like beta-propeller repeat protein [Alphaproteobacteria bacterium]